MHLVNWFWLIVLKFIENHNKSISLRPMYQYNFYERRKYIQKIIYVSDTFVCLCSRLEATGIVSSTKNMLVDEQVAMTVHILAHNQKQRIINANFERSGALDGTHIKVRVPIEDKPRYRTCKNKIATNFIYVLPSWEGSTANGKVLRDAISRRNDLVVPRGQRYHLNDWSERHQSTTVEEFFNMKHSSTRNIIERLFGLLKSRWEILRSSLYYPIKIQNRFIIICCLLHNFIRQEMGGYQIDDEDNIQDEEKGEGEHLNINEVDEDEESVTMIKLSDEWTTFRKNLAINIFNTWRAQRNPR
ncbi:hypothetical protein Pfo_020441 [Paulownia fortunei]|nr:hypothetical protein Pfo_020441 [Paulownia fortunei]